MRVDLFGKVGDAYLGLYNAARDVAALATADPTPLETGAWIAALARDLCNPFSQRRGYLEVGCHRGATFYQVLAEAMPLDGRRFYLVEPVQDYCREIAGRVRELVPEALDQDPGGGRLPLLRIAACPFQQLTDPEPFRDFFRAEFLAEAMADCRVAFWDEGLDGRGVKTYLQDFLAVGHLVTVDQVHIFHDADSRGIDDLERELRWRGMDTLRLPVPRGVLIARLMPKGRLRLS